MSRLSFASELSEIIENEDIRFQSLLPRSALPLDFIYDARTDSYSLTEIETDQELIERIQLGTTEKVLIGVNRGIIKIRDLFG